MNVKLVSLSNPCVTGINDPEELISYCARVSNPDNQLNTETAPKLLSYLIKHKHWSPFEMVSMCVEVQTSRAIAAQILRHRSFSFQEFSQRYSSATELEPIEFRKQGKTNRQVGDEEIQLTPLQASLVDQAENACLVAYKHLLGAGIAKECARMVLPLSTQTTMYMSGTIRSWIHYIDLRATQDTQKEHREIALAIKKIFIEKFPNVSDALDWSN